MSLVEELQRKKGGLRTVQELKDRSKPLLDECNNSSRSGVQDFKNNIHAVNLENWYPQLKEYTFETTFLNLSQEEARAIVSTYQQKQRQECGKEQPAAEEEEQLHLLSQLKERINDGIKAFVGGEGEDGGAFVRLSTRSPKDATIAGDKTMRLFEEELERMEKEEQVENAREDENARLVALIVASTKAMMVRSGEEALQLITTSERSHEDLLLALEFPEEWDMKVIIRKWVNIHPSMEFRGFVCHKKFTALSQYFHIAYFPQLKQQRNSILANITECYAKVQDLIPVDSFIVDFAVLNDGQVLVIELNPFHNYEGCGTDAGLFNWALDRKIVDGEAPFEFRVREEAFDVKQNLIGLWRDIVRFPK
ncbi:Cell division cycle protein 123 [Balamuthia mandrillaris]